MLLNQLVLISNRVSVWFDTSGGEDNFQIKVWYDSNLNDANPGTWVTPQAANIGLTGTSGTLPISSSGGTTPNITIAAAATDGSACWYC